VANATRGSGQTLTPAQPVGTWGTASNKLYLSSTSGGSGYQPLITWDFGKGDGSCSLTLDSYNTTMIMALRIVDASNLLMAYADGSQIHLYKVAAGVASDLPVAVSLSISSTNSVVMKVVTLGNLINIFVNVNGGGFPTTPQLTYTLSGADATTYANTNTKWGVIQITTSTNRFSSFVFNDTLTAGDKLGQLVELSGATSNIGDLKQATAASQMTWQAMPSMFGSKQFLYNAGQVLSYSTSSFSSKDAPFTLFWAGVLPIDTGAGRTLMLVWDGIGTHSCQIALTTANRLYIGANSSVTLIAPAFSGYPLGPVILRAEINGSSSKLYINGQLAVSGTLPSVTGQVLVQFGDSSSLNYVWCLHGSLFNAILTATQAREHERLIASTFAIEGWNPR
jgi:hypothetical protein